MTATDIAVASGLAHGFGTGSLLFQHVDLRIAANSSVAITGPSGVGKTTLLSIVGGAMPATGGSVCYRWLNVGTKRLSPIAWVLQTSNAFGNRSTLANIAMPALLAGVKPDEARKRVVDVATTLGIDHLLETKARRLSGGELQRVGIARSIASEPDLLIADEPTGQLDSESSSAVIAALLEARRGMGEPDSRRHGFAIIVATHDERLAAACDRRFELTAEGLVAW